MASRPADKKLRLHHILTIEAGVDENIAKWIAEAEHGPQCESPADVAKLWASHTIDIGPKLDVLELQAPTIDATSFKGRKLLGRLQTAWDYCTQDHAGESHMLAKPPKTEERLIA